MFEVIQPLLSIVTTTLCSYLVWWLQTTKKKKDYTTDALKLLMKRELKEEYERLMKEGRVSVAELSHVTELYNTYHNLGGNGEGTIMYEKIKSLDIKEE